MFRGNGTFTLVPLVVGWPVGVGLCYVHNFQRQNFLGIARGRRVQLGNHGISSLLFPDVVLSASSSQDLQHVTEQFAAECEATGSQWKSVAYPLWVVGKFLPQEEEFKYLRVLYCVGKNPLDPDQLQLNSGTAALSF